MDDRADNIPETSRIRLLDEASSRFLVSTRNIVPETSSGVNPFEDLHLKTYDQNRPVWRGYGGTSGFGGGGLQGGSIAMTSPEGHWAWGHYDRVFTKRMLGTLRGYPRWYPGPWTRLPLERSRKGFLIGDLAILRGHAPDPGSLATFFNIFLPADHPVNKGKVPDEFTPFPLNPNSYITQRKFQDDAYIASSSVRAVRKEATPDGSTVEFEANGPEGAIFGLPCGVTSEDLEDMPGLQQYIADNIFSWYAFLFKTTHVPFFNGDLRIIIGTDTSTAWTRTLFVSTDATSTSDFRAKFTTKRTTDGVTWSYQSSGTNYEIMGGPDIEEINDLRDPEDTSSDYCCHTLFVRTLNPMLGDRYWNVLEKGDRHGKKEPPSELFTGLRKTFTPVTSRLPRALSISHLADRARSVIQRIRPPEEPKVYFVGDLMDHIQVEHPSNNLNKQILKKMPWAKMVITDDHDWLHSVRDDDDFSTDMLESLAARILSTKSVRHRHGILVLS